jgi:hypothetical protein
MSGIRQFTYETSPIEQREAELARLSYVERDKLANERLRLRIKEAELKQWNRELAKFRDELLNLRAEVRSLRRRVGEENLDSPEVLLCWQCRGERY